MEEKNRTGFLHKGAIVILSSMIGGLGGAGVSMSNNRTLPERVIVLEIKEKVLDKSMLKITDQLSNISKAQFKILLELERLKR